MIKMTGASSLTAYGAAASQYGMLTPELELELVARYQETGCRAARDQIIHAHICYVMVIARNLGGGREDREDLIQEGCLGLITALDKFVPEKGFRFAMYAGHWAKAAIKQYMLDTMRMFRIATTAPQRKCFYNLHKFKKTGQVFTQREVEDIAQALSVPVDDVREMERKLVGHDLSLNVDPTESQDLMNSLYDEDCDPALIVERENWSNKAVQHINEAFDTLDSRSRHILNSRFVAKDKQTLHELGAMFGVTHARIGQLEGKALKVVRENLRHMAA